MESVDFFINKELYYKEHYISIPLYVTTLSRYEINLEKLKNEQNETKCLHYKQILHSIMQILDYIIKTNTSSSD